MLLQDAVVPQAYIALRGKDVWAANVIVDRLGRAPSKCDAMSLPMATKLLAIFSDIEIILRSIDQSGQKR
jgi:hypothetical protein